MSLESSAAAAAYESHKSFLWGLGYRMCGTVEDADDVLQETFLQLLTQPPADPATPILPWLTRLALDYARHLLRQRRAGDYPGVWLPGPVPSERLEIPGYASLGPISLEASARFAALLALEPLEPDARAILLLRDVFDFPAARSAEILGLEEAAAEAELAVARRALADLPQPAGDALVRRFGVALQAGEEALTEVVAADARLLCDAGGVVEAPLSPVVGCAAVVAQCLAFFRGRAAPVERSLNGEPALVCNDEPAPGFAGRAVLRVEGEALVEEVQLVLTPAKLGGLWGSG